jgi:hypothetical protein
MPYAHAYILLPDLPNDLAVNYCGSQSRSKLQNTAPYEDPEGGMSQLAVV